MMGGQPNGAVPDDTIPPEKPDGNQNITPPENPDENMAPQGGMTPPEMPDNNMNSGNTGSINNVFTVSGISNLFSGIMAYGID